MLKNVSSKALWFGIFAVVVAVQAYSAFGQTSEIVGEWNNGSVGMIQYQNRTTGATKPGRGSVFSYKFLPNGTYQFTGYMESTMYNCTTSLFNQVDGKYSVEGSTIYLNPTRDFWKSGNTCAASGNKQQTKTPVRKTAEFRITEDEFGKTLLCLTEGSGETCYRRETD